MGTFGRIDPEDGIQEGWVRDDNDELGVDGYNVFLATTTNDGTSGVRAINSTGGVTFYSKSDGDGYVARNLGVGTEFPTEKLEVIGVTKTSGLQVTTSPTIGYVLTSDANGVATWQPPADVLLDGYVEEQTFQEHKAGQEEINNDIIKSLDGYVEEQTFQEHKSGQEEINNDIIKSLDGYLDSEDHRDLDQLVHDIAETSFEEITYSGNKVSSIIVWTDSGKTTKIREQQFAYSGNKVDTITSIQYDSGGLAAETLTESYNYDGSKVNSIDRTLT